MKMISTVVAMGLFFPLSVFAASVPCQSLDSVKNTQTPVELTQAMVSCVRTNRYQEAVELFYLINVLGKFDKLRVADQTAHQALHIIQQRATEQFSEEQLGLFNRKWMETLGQDDLQPRLCAATQKMGIPVYKPTYMTNHGMAAFMERSERSVDPTEGGGPPLGDEMGFDEQHAWEHVRTQFLKCP